MKRWHKILLDAYVAQHADYKTGLEGIVGLDDPWQCSDDDRRQANFDLGQTMKIIFLDIDGVLVNDYSWTHASQYPRELADPACVKQLNRIVNETGAYVVISSAWRTGRTISELKDIFRNWKIACKLIGGTPVIFGVERGVEIQKWLDSYEDDLRYGPVESFVIIDDRKDMAHLTPHLTLTDMGTGLTREKADEAIALLKQTNQKGASA